MKKDIGRFRHWIQAAFFAVTNGYYKGFSTGRIYTGKTKYICAPGLNCYSCPGALNACPIGSLQAVLDSRRFTFSCYVFGSLMAFGAFFGRLVCGWMCPFGFVQDLLHKIPVRHKYKNMPGHRYLRHLRWAVLLMLVLILPSVVVNVAGMGRPWFCEFLCPSGTLFGGLPLTILNPGLRNAIGVRFIWKISLLAALLAASVFFYRPFCKYLCPLGLIYGLFNPVSLYHYNVNRNKCVKCGACQKACGMDIRVWETPDSQDCIRCGACRTACPEQAISSVWKLKTVKKRAGCPAGDRTEHRPVIGLLITAALLIGAGITTGEPAEVFAKAVKICMECIGIG